MFCPKRSFKRRFWAFAKWAQRGSFENWIVLWGDMRIYCRWVKIVFVLRIHIATKFFCHPVDGPQLAWEQSAIRPPSVRYQPISPRARRKDARFFLPRALFCTIRDSGYYSIPHSISCLLLYHSHTSWISSLFRLSPNNSSSPVNCIS